MQSGKKNDLAVIGKARDLCAYVMEATQKSPKAFRFSFVGKLQNLSLEIVENLLRANNTALDAGMLEEARRRADYQKEALVSSRVLAYMAEMAYSQECITMKQFEQISRLTSDVQNMIGAWMKSDTRRIAGKKA